MDVYAEYTSKCGGANATSSDSTTSGHDPERTFVQKVLEEFGYWTNQRSRETNVLTDSDVDEGGLTVIEKGLQMSHTLRPLSKGKA